MRFELTLGIMLLAACPESGLDGYRPASFEGGGKLAEASPIPPAVLEALGGLYDVSGPLSGFGATVSSSTRAGEVSFFGGLNAAYAVAAAGCLGDALVLEGYWRHGTGQASGLMRFGAAGACAGGAGALVLRGGFAADEASLGEGTTLTRRRAPCRPTRKFYAVAHRGGCRTQDFCGASENSAEVIRMAESLGANGIELDVRVTRDGALIVFHDESFNPRLVTGKYCLGPVAQLSLPNIETFCRLWYGEPVPTLSEALEVAVRDTKLTAIWLDVKDPRAMPATIRELRAAERRALELGRSELQIAIGLSSEELLEAYLAEPDRPRCLSELDPEATARAGCDVWAQRWTLGPQPEETARFRSRGGLVVFWTADEPEYIDALLEGSSVDGILTNRPGVVRHRFESVLGERCE